MPYLPLKPSGRADDLLAILVRAEEARYARAGVVMPEKPASARAWLEPLGNLVGRALYGMLSCAPNSTLAGLQEKGWRTLASPNLFPFEPAHSRLAQARRLVETLTKDGRPPALLCVFTHPPVTGQWLHLNIELTRHALWALGAMRAKAPRPRLIVAVDPFALDGFGLFVEGAYAGFMGSLHLGFDRLASHRGPLSRALVGSTAWSRIAHRLLRRLNERGEVGIPLGGGVPTTSRALYSAKEFVWELRRRPRSLPPAEVLRRLAAADSGFAAFSESPFVSPGLKRSAWRMLEAWMLAVTAGAWGGDSDASSGEGPSVDRAALTPAARSAALACARAMGLSEKDGAAAAAELDRELARETPYRPRLFRVLARRVAGGGTPLVLLPLAHGKPPEVRIDWGEPAAFVDARAEEVTVLRPDGRRETLPIGRFARAFVDANLP